MVVVSAAHMGVRLWFARRLAGMGVRRWAARTLLPLACATAAAGAFGLLPRLAMGPSLWRVGVTALCAEALFLPLAWRLALDGEERAFVWERVRARLPRAFAQGGKGL